MRLYVLDNGYLSTPKSAMITGGGDEMVKMPINLFLLDTKQGWVLLDTGCHPDSMHGHWREDLVQEWPYFCTEDQRLENQLALCGITPADVKTVVISHFHLDHTGNLHLFPHADIYVPKDEFLFALYRVHASSDPVAHGGYIKADIEVPVRQYHLIEEDTPLMPGVELISLPGHSPGLLGMLVHLNTETVLLPQDCVYSAEIYGPPVKPCGSTHDDAEYYRSIEKLRALAEKYHARVIFGHDEEQFQTLKHAPEYYE